MAVQGSGVELGQDHDLADVPMQAVGYRDIDEAEFAADRDRRLGAEFGQRVEPRPPPASEDYGKDIFHDRILISNQINVNPEMKRGSMELYVSSSSLPP
jgi:hypothetical protein